MGVSFFKFNGVSSETFDIRIEKCPDYPVAQRVVERIHVDGRNGDLVRDTGAYNNVDMKYSIYFNAKSSSFQDVARSVAFWLNGSSGYCRLEDSYDPDVYRMAVMSNYTEYRNWMNDYGRADVTFSCKPQRFLKIGEDWQTITSGSAYVNWGMPCYPIIEVTGNGFVTYGSTTILVNNNASATLMFDTDLQDAYTGDLSHEPFNIPYHLSVFQGGPQVYSQTVMLPRNWSDYSTVHVQYVTLNPDADGILDIDTSINFSQKVGDWTISHNSTDGFITFSLDGTQIVPPGGRQFMIDGAVTSLINRNSDISISGAVEPFDEGSTTIYHNASTVRIMPRAWTL